MTPDNLVVVSAADDAYALPLAVTVRSLLDHLATDRVLTLFVLDGGLSSDNKRRLLDSWADPRLTVEWVACPPALVHGLTVSGHVSPTAYARLLMHRLLPPGIGKILYIDADLLIRGDVGRLWDEPLDDHVMLAVTDAGAPVLDATVALPAFDRCGKWLVTARPIPNYEACGLSPHGRYFNSGVMLIDFVRWRERGIGDRALQVLREHERHVLWWDQYALNIVLAGQWGELDGRWNQVAAIFRYPHWQNSPFDRRIFKAIRHDPWVIHFCSADKPWQRGSRHPWTRRYRAMIRRTAWRQRPANAARPPCRREWRPLLRPAGRRLAGFVEALLAAGPSQVAAAVAGPIMRLAAVVGRPVLVVPRPQGSAAAQSLAEDIDDAPSTCLPRHSDPRRPSSDAAGLGADPGAAGVGRPAADLQRSRSRGLGR